MTVDEAKKARKGIMEVMEILAFYQGFIDTRDVLESYAVTVNGFLDKLEQAIRADERSRSLASVGIHLIPGTDKIYLDPDKFPTGEVVE